jgi:hypothetical protein
MRGSIIAMPLILVIMLVILSVLSVLFAIGTSDVKTDPACQLIDSNLRPSAMYFTRFCRSGHIPDIRGSIIAIGQTLDNTPNGPVSRIGLNLTPRELYKIACVTHCQEAYNEKLERMGDP